MPRYFRASFAADRETACPPANHAPPTDLISPSFAPTGQRRPPQSNCQAATVAAFLQFPQLFASLFAFRLLFCDVCFSNSDVTMATQESNEKTVASLPSGEPIDSANAPATPPPRKPSAVAVTATSVDAFLSRLHRCATSRGGADAVLFFLTYATRLSAGLLEAGSRAALRSSANKLVAVALQLPPQAAVTFTSENIIGASPVIGVALNLAARLNNASALLSDVRTFGRLWGLLGLYFAAKKLLVSLKSKPAGEKSADAKAESRFDAILSVLQIASLISFQAAENIVYLSSKKILGFSPQTQGRLAKISVRSWALYIGMELGRLTIERQRRVAASGGRLTAKDQEWSRKWKTDFFRNLAWSPITLHYSVEKGFLSDLALSALAFHPAQSQMRELWAANA